MSTHCHEWPAGKVNAEVQCLSKPTASHILRESMDIIQNKTQQSTIKKNIEDTEIESLDKKREELRQKANKTLKDKVEYAEPNNLVKKKRRTRARRKRKELIQETLEARKGPRQINKHRNKRILMSIRKESGEIASDREEILKIWADFYMSLNTQTVPTPESTTNINSRHRRSTRVYRRGSGKHHKTNEETQSTKNEWNYM